MFIHYGKKRLVKLMGRVADFCPICRELRPFKLERINVATHIYGVPLGSGKTMGYEITCEVCGSRYQTDATIYKVFAGREHDQDPVELLLGLTQPDARKRYHDRLALEQKIRSNPMLIPPATRQQIIREPFLLVSPQAENKLKDVILDLPVGIAAIAAIVVPWLLSGALESLHAASDLEIWIVTGTVGLGIAATVMQGFLARRRFLRKEIYPRLVRALRPVRPTSKELSEALQELRHPTRKFIRKVDLGYLESQLEARSQMHELSGQPV